MSHESFLRAHYIDQPYEVSIETLALCNAACTFCPYPTLERKGTRLPDDKINSLIEEMSHWAKPFYISPFKVNEPFLDKRLMSICHDINRRIPHAMLRLFTNGSPLTFFKLREVDSLRNVAHLWVSLNSHEPEEYKNLMSLEFENTATKLDTLHGMLRNGNFRHPVVLSKVTSGGDEYGFLSFCAHRWPLFQVCLIKRDGWLGYVPPMDPAIPDTPCNRWFELSIMATGIVSLCCMDGKGEFPIGNIYSNNLRDIYNEPFWRDRRERMISRRNTHPCSTCTY